MRERRLVHRWTTIGMLLLFPLPASAALVITEIQPQTTSGTASEINGDWWELTNTGPGRVDLAGYMWADTEDDLFGSDPAPNIFPSYAIAAGESIILLDHPSASEAAWRANWGLSSAIEILTSDEMVDNFPPDGDTFSRLGNSNDAVFFYHPLGNLLDSYTWPSNVRGTTFEFGLDGSDRGLSVVGEYGAVQALNGDVGSPGSAVPEPTTVLIASASLAAALLLRRVR